jgi:hypothetical protein
MKLRYKVISKDGSSFVRTRDTTKREMTSWKNAYNRNYANGRKAPKSQGVSKIVYLSLNKKRPTQRKSLFGGFKI